MTNTQSLLVNTNITICVMFQTEERERGDKDCSVYKKKRKKKETVAKSNQIKSNIHEKFNTYA